MILFWITIVSIIVQASLLPIDEDTDKRTGHNIMRFGRQAGHNILRFGRTPGHNIMRFGKREESNSAPGSSYEISESKLPSIDQGNINRYILDQLSPSSSSSSLSPSSSLSSSSPSLSGLAFNGYDMNASPLAAYGYYGQASPLTALFYNQRSPGALPYQQAKKGRPETDHVIMRFG
uniref:Uncharacterized protein n=2 Tax=Tetranychus urticae TaxID=32264 RepID=T1KHN8_TETUR